MKPSVGLTVLTSSPNIFLTIVVLPALSSPLDTAELEISISDQVRHRFLQHQNAHLLVLETSFSQNRQHRLCYLSYCSCLLPKARNKTKMILQKQITG